MHDFPMNHCLTSFEHVCKELRGRSGKDEWGWGAFMMLGWGGWWLSRGCGTVEWWAGPNCPFIGELYIFYSSSV